MISGQRQPERACQAALQAYPHDTQNDSQREEDHDNEADDSPIGDLEWPQPQKHRREGATHAWIEALMPGLGWVGFDPTNDLIAGVRHIRTAVGRDYADVPPTVGTMKGRAETELQVRVRVVPSQSLLPADDDFAADEEWSLFLEDDPEAQAAYELQQRQQQQQQQQ